MTTITSNADLVRAWADTGPDWLAALRLDAWERYESFPALTGREEVWRYTDLGLLRPDDFLAPSPDGDGATLAPLPERARAALELTGTESGGLALHADGRTVSATLSDQARAAGVVYTDLQTAVSQHADLLRPRLGTLVAADDPYRALSLGLHSGGSFLYVPRGVELSAPIQALHWLSAEGAAVFPRTVVVVEDDAKVVFNDVYSSDDLARPTLVAPVTELFVGRGAQVGWVTWQDWGAGVRHLANVKAHIDSHALLNTLLVTLGGDFSRTWKECALAGEGAESYMWGLYFPHGSQRFEHWTVQDHVAPRTKSDLLYKGALTDEARALYYGTIRVRHAAKGTDAYQANRNLTLSPKAKADTNPQLEIETNDVRCTHGATVGRVNEEHVFYLMSRGIPRREAERLLVFGFFNEVLGRVEWSGMTERLADAIRRKVEG